MLTFRAHAPASDESAAADLLLLPMPRIVQDLNRRLQDLGKDVAARCQQAIEIGDLDTSLLSGFLLTHPSPRFPRLLVVETDEGASPATVRSAFAQAGRDPRLRRARRIAVLCDRTLGTGGDLVRGVAEATDGLLEGTYAWTAAADPEDMPLESCVFLTRNARQAARATEGIEHGSLVGRAVCTARDLANAPANLLSPAEMAGAARGMARRVGLRCRVLEEAGLARERCHAILTVGRGSERPPRLIVLEHQGRAGVPPVVLVGKGLVFDTGGLNIKSGASMAAMKFDKCGGCAVLGVMEAVAALRLPVPVVGIVPAVENSISGESYRPGDVIGSRSGKTIEVLNTDAEGRIVLADALDYAVTKYRPQAVVDIATLTGSAYHALGDHACAVLGTDETLVRRIREAGERTGERAWELPLWKEHLLDVETPNADIRNTGRAGAGAIAGAAFLRAFVGESAWAHLDIANVARDRRDEKIGATGFGVRLLVEMLRRWPAPRVRKRAPGSAERRSRTRRRRP